MVFSKLHTGTSRIAPAAAAMLGLFTGSNGFAMLVDPLGWFWSVPGVPLTGGYNAHFVRDIGIVYLLTGAAFVGGIFRPANRPLLWGAGAAWLGAHAIFHLVEVATGLCGPDAIPRDFVGVTAPALAAAGLYLSALARRSRTAPPATGPAANSRIWSADPQRDRDRSA